MKFKSEINNNNIDFSILLNNGEFIYNKLSLNNKDKLFSLFKLSELYLLEENLNSSINLEKNSSALALKLPESFYLNTLDKKEIQKLQNKIKNSNYLNHISNNFKLKGKSDDFIKNTTKKIILNKSEIIKNTFINLYKSYMFYYIFISVIHKNLILRFNKYQRNSFITPDFELSKNFYSSYEYYINLNKGDLNWINKNISFFNIFKKELMNVLILTHSLVEDIFSNNNYSLTFNNYKEELINLIYISSKNIKKTKMSKPLIINNLNEEIEKTKIKTIQFNTFIYSYDRLEKNNLNYIIKELNDFINIDNFNIFIKYGNIKMDLLFTEIQHIYLNIINFKR